MTINSNRSYRQINPNSIDAWFLDGFDPNPSWPIPLWKHRDMIRYVVGRIAVEQAMYPRSRRFQDGIVPIRREDVWPLFGRHDTWNEVRKELLKRGILECDETFEKGIKSKWYKIGWDWRYCEVNPVAISNPAVIKRITGFEDIRSNRDHWEPVHYHLDWWLKQVRVDESLVRRWIAQRHRSFKQYQTSLKIALLQSGLAGLKIDPYGRVHDPVTSLRRAVRIALRIGDMPLAEVDISNAQPLLIGYVATQLVSEEWSLDQVLSLGKKMSDGSMFQNYIRLAKGTEKGRTKEERKQNQSLSVPDLHLRYNLLNLSMSPVIPGLPSDLLEYLRVCEQGIFYQTLAELWGLDYEECKGEIKMMVFKFMLFGRIRKFHPYWKLVCDRWPTVAMVLELVKADDKGVSARLCQRLESSLMIGEVADQFRLIYPEIPVQTIHDSLLVPSDAVGIAQDTILDAFGVLGLKPSLKVKQAV